MRPTDRPGSEKVTERTKRNLAEAYSVLNSFRCVIKSLRLADRAGLKEHGLGAAQLYVLHELSRDAPLSVNDLAERTGTDQSTVSVVVAKLIAKGYVARERAESDARRLQLTLTARGHLLARALPPPIQHRIIEGVQRLPAARAQVLAESLREVCDVLGIADDHPPMFFGEDLEERRRKAPVAAARPVMRRAKRRTPGTK